jgi:uncharacterized membrane protein
MAAPRGLSPIPAAAEHDDEVDSLEIRAAAAERLTFFADAVVAIAITLLALDLPVPEGGSNAEMLRSVGAQPLRDHYLAFLISFLVIAAHWSGHHRVFRYVTKLGGSLSRLTIYWLLMQVVTPFATRVLTGDGAFQVRFIFYAGVQAVAGLLFLLMLRDIRRHRLTRAETPPGMLADASLRTVTIAAAFLVSIPLSFVTEWAYACWAVIPVAESLVRRLVHRRARRS